MMDGAGLLGGGDDGSTKPPTSTGSGSQVARISADAAGAVDEAMQRQALETHGSSFLPSVFQYLCCGLLCKCGRVAGDHWGVEVPRSPEELRELGPDWVTGALQAAGAIATNNACTSLELKPLGATGAFGEMILCSWTFAKETDLPAEVICKFPQKEKLTRLLAAAGGMYEVELHYCNTICYKLSP